MRVAIVGSGVTGCSCAWQLLQGGQQPVAVTLFEMGRGAGGRTSTRRTRELPGIGLNHGAPLFHISLANANVEPLIAALKAANRIVDWRGTFGSVDAITGALGRGSASRGEPSAPELFARYAGVPGMSSLADGILELAGKGSAEAKYGTKIGSFRPHSKGVAFGWELQDKDGNDLGEFDWIVVTSASLAHPRWRETFGEAPPIELAARLSGSPRLVSVVEHLQKLRFTGVHVAMLVWEVSERDDGGVMESLQSLPFDITEVVGDEVLGKVVRQSIGPPYAAVILHSTPAFAHRHAKVFGSTGTTAKMCTTPSNPEEEAAVAVSLQSAFQRLLTERLGGKVLSAPTWGPVLHRWGSAFPEGDSVADAQPALVLPEARVAFAGDFLSPPYACVETAMNSGLMAATEILKEGTTCVPQEGCSA